MTTSQDRNEVDRVLRLQIEHTRDAAAAIRGAAEAHAQYRPATYFDDEYWQHRCGVAEVVPPNWSGWITGSGVCDACELETPVDEWRRLYVRDGRNLESDPPNPSSADALAVEVERLRAERGEAWAEIERLWDLRTKGERWRCLVVNLTRCEHGRIQGDVCSSCPDRVSPDRSGTHLGHSLDGVFRIVVPPRARMSDPEAWYDRGALATYDKETKRG